ncbi:UNVERIFIED_CONTAM: hypothetical protein RMT77_010645 [Armadillidium vulgare]
MMSDIEVDSSGSEWIPGSESDGESDEIPISIRNTHKSPLKIQKKTAHTEDTGKIEIHQKGSKTAHTEDTRKIEIHQKGSKTAHTEDTGKIEIHQEGSKKQACLYCWKLVSKIGRHLVEVHYDKIEVKKIISMPVNSEERRWSLRKLRLEGNFHHNISVLKQKQGKFIVQKQIKRKGSPCKPEDYVPCVNCLGFYFKRDARRHFANCNVSENQIKASVKKGYQLLNSYVYELTKEISIFFGGMKKDEVTAAASQDDLIIGFVESMLNQRKNIREIRQQARLLSRFLIKLKEQHGEEYDLKSFINPVNFDNLVRTAKSMSYAKDKPDNPITLGIHLGQVLCKCCTVLNIKSLKSGDKNMGEKIKNVEALLRTQWSQEINIPLRVDLHESKENKNDNLPATEDIVTLSKSINERISLGVLKLKENVSEHNWRKLANVVLAHLILFNKRREGEVSRMLLSDYLKRPVSYPVNKEIEQSLSVTERALLQKLNMVKVRGKRGRHVPILLTEKAKLALDILCETRCQIVPAENPFMFPSKGVSHIRGSDAMAKESKHCDLKQPELLTSTRLRKYVATVSQIMNLKENEMDWLASHLGHDINIHRHFYRLQDSTIELTKISKLLIAIDEGYAHRVAGKNLDTVNEEIPLSNLLKDSDESSHIKGKRPSNKYSIKMEKVVDNSELVAENMASGEVLLEKEDDAECKNNLDIVNEEIKLSNFHTDSDESSYVKGKSSSNKYSIKMEKVVDNSELVAENMASGEVLLEKEDDAECKNNLDIVNEEIKLSNFHTDSDESSHVKGKNSSNHSIKMEKVADYSNVTVASSSNDKVQSCATYIKGGSKNISQRQTWPTETKSLAFKYFAHNIKNKIPPKQCECLKFISKYKIKNRSWKDVKALIFNTYYVRK